MRVFKRLLGLLCATIFLPFDFPQSAAADSSPLDCTANPPQIGCPTSRTNNKSQSSAKEACIDPGRDKCYASIDDAISKSSATVLTLYPTDANYLSSKPITKNITLQWTSDNGSVSTIESAQGASCLKIRGKASAQVKVTLMGINFKSSGEAPCIDASFADVTLIKSKMSLPSSAPADCDESAVESMHCMTLISVANGRIALGAEQSNNNSVLLLGGDRKSSVGIYVGKYGEANLRNSAVRYMSVGIDVVGSLDLGDGAQILDDTTGIRIRSPFSDLDPNASKAVTNVVQSSFKGNGTAVLIDAAFGGTFALYKSRIDCASGGTGIRVASGSSGAIGVGAASEINDCDTGIDAAAAIKIDDTSFKNNTVSVAFASPSGAFVTNSRFWSRQLDLKVTGGNPVFQNNYQSRPGQRPNKFACEPSNAVAGCREPWSH